MRHIIIGAGPAGVVAAETLRKLEPDAQVTIIGDEPEPPYSRMAIPYLLSNQVDEYGTYLRKGDGHFADHKIEVMRDRVTSVDASGKSVSLAGGAGVAFDRLLIATGSRPLSPPVSGIDAAGVTPCWTLQHARDIAQRAQPGARVVLIGAGFIACIILEALVRRGARVSVVEQQEHMVSRMVKPTASDLIKTWCEGKGVNVHTSTRVDAIETGPPLAVRLDNGATLEADLVVTATGVLPNMDFLNGAAINTDVGILVDTHLATSAAGIYAAGDVAQGLDFSTGGYSVHAVQPTAADHGRVAAANMAGRDVVYNGSVIMNVLDTLGLIASSFGLWMGAEGGDSAELVDKERFRYLNLQFEDDLLVGGSSLGLTDHVGVMRGLIQSRIRLKGWKQRLLQNPTRLMEAYVANTQAIGYNARVL